MSKFIVVGCKIDYPTLDLKLFKEDQDMYNMGILIAADRELKRGLRIKRINKPTRKGTGITFEAIKTKEEEAQYRLDMRQRVNELFERIKNIGPKETVSEDVIQGN